MTTGRATLTIVASMMTSETPKPMVSRAAQSRRVIRGAAAASVVGEDMAAVSQQARRPAAKPWRAPRSRAACGVRRRGAGARRRTTPRPAAPPAWSIDRNVVSTTRDRPWRLKPRTSRTGSSRSVTMCRSPCQDAWWTADQHSARVTEAGAPMTWHSSSRPVTASTRETVACPTIGPPAALLTKARCHDSRLPSRLRRLGVATSNPSRAANREVGAARGGGESGDVVAPVVRPVRQAQLDEVRAQHTGAAGDEPGADLLEQQDLGVDSPLGGGVHRQVGPLRPQAEPQDVRLRQPAEAHQHVIRAGAHPDDRDVGAASDGVEGGAGGSIAASAPASSSGRSSAVTPHPPIRRAPSPGTFRDPPARHSARDRTGRTP